MPTGKPTGLLERTMGHMFGRIQKNPFRGAWRATAIVTVSATVVSGLLMRLTDPHEFSSIWQGLWWATQTVTTVGYGDVVPTSVAGRVLASLTMLIGVTFITVTSAAIASRFVEAARLRRLEQQPDDETTAGLAREVKALATEVRRLRQELDAAGVTPPPKEP